MKLHATITLREAAEFAATGIAVAVENELPVARGDVTAEIESASLPQPDYSIRNNPEIGRHNQIYLIKMIRCAIAAANGAQFGLGEAKAFVEEYINNPEKH